MSTTIYANKVTGYDTMDGRSEFTLEAEDGDVFKLKVDTFCTLDKLGELFEAIRAGVEMISAERVVGE